LGTCKECGIKLTKEEMKYYDYRCEVCEDRYFNKIEAWLRGAFYPELDELFESRRVGTDD